MSAQKLRIAIGNEMEFNSYIVSVPSWTLFREDILALIEEEKTAAVRLAGYNAAVSGVAPVNQKQRLDAYVQAALSGLLAGGSFDRVERRAEKLAEVAVVQARMTIAEVDKL